MTNTVINKPAVVTLRNPSLHSAQLRLVYSKVKRLIVKAGRRGGKTVGLAIRAAVSFLAGRRVLYAAPTSEQTDKFWFEVKRALSEPIQAGMYKLNESERFIEKAYTENRIKAKTAWNADMLRGDYADLLLFDEFQLTNENAWDEVGAPMLLDNNGDAVFVFTPPSLASEGISKARDPRHASKLFKKALADTTGLWETLHFTSHDNPFISREGLGIVTQDMSLESYRREIMAEDDEIETSWLVHCKFNESLCKIKRFTIPANWDVFTGHDFGAANPAALFIARVKLPLPPGAPAYIRQHDLVIFREYEPGTGYSTVQHVERFKEMATSYTVRRSRGGNFNTEDEIRQGYTNAGWNIQPPGLEKKNSQIDRVIQLEENNQLYIFSDLYRLLSEVSNCMWKLDKENKVTNDIANESMFHLSACLRSIASDNEFRPVIVTGGTRLTQHVYR